jgi:hypothetical protein
MLPEKLLDHPCTFTLDADAFGADPKVASDVNVGHRYNAACHLHHWLPPSRGRTPPS